MSAAFVGLGSNLEQPIRQVEDALEELDRLPQTRVVKRSSLYRSAPVGYSAQPDFINAVAELETALAPERLLSGLQELEARHGRKRSFANAPRTLDLDLLLFAKVQMKTERLTVPHPRMHERAFVLQPLVEIAPGIEIPGLGKAAESLGKLSGQAVQRIA